MGQILSKAEFQEAQDRGRSISLEGHYRNPGLYFIDKVLLSVVNGIRIYQIHHSSRKWDGPVLTPDRAIISTFQVYPTRKQPHIWLDGSSYRISYDLAPQLEEILKTRVPFGELVEVKANQGHIAESDGLVLIEETREAVKLQKLEKVAIDVADDIKAVRSQLSQYSASEIKGILSSTAEKLYDAVRGEL